MQTLHPCAGSTLYATAGSGNSVKPALALRQLEIPHRIVLVDVLSGETRKPGYLAINKFGQVPYLVDRTGFGVAESNAALWYIAEGSDLLPDNPQDRALTLQWMFFEQTRLEPNISPARFFSHIVPERGRTMAVQIEQWRAKALDGLTYLNEHLSTARFIVKRHGYSIADIATFGYVHLAGEAGIDLRRFGSITKWIARVEATQNFLPIGELLRVDPDIMRRPAVGE